MSMTQSSHFVNVFLSATTGAVGLYGAFVADKLIVGSALGITAVILGLVYLKIRKIRKIRGTL